MLNLSAHAATIKLRLLTVLILLAIGYLLLLSMVQFTAVATRDHLRQVSTSFFPAALRIQDAESAFELLQKRYKDAILLEDPKALAAAAQDAATVAASLRDLRRQLAPTPSLALQAGALASRFDSIQLRSQATYAAILAARDLVSPSLQAQAAALAAEDHLFAAELTTLEQDITVHFRAQLDDVDALASRARIAGLILLLVALVGCAGAFWVIQYQFVLPLERLIRSLKDIAHGNGDLTARVAVNGHTEIDEVGRWFNVFVERIEAIVIRVSGNSSALSTAAGDLAAIARETAAHTALQQEQATGITISMHNISAAGEEISQNTHTAAGDARRAEQNAHASGETIQATVAIIQRLLFSRQTTATKVADLGAASQAIGKIVAVIDDIANQTSLLALNASIESARAGEHGRGFAVVATEVRRLAERTSKATREIDLTVRAIQSGTAEVVEAMGHSMREVESSVTFARSAGEALASIIQGSEAVQQIVTQIAAASSEQSAATQSVNENLNEISRLGLQTTAPPPALSTPATTSPPSPPISTHSSKSSKPAPQPNYRAPAPTIAPGWNGAPPCLPDLSQPALPCEKISTWVPH